MTDPTPTPPLWRVMQDAEQKAPLVVGKIGGGEPWLARKKAAELRAVADAVDAHFDDDYIPLHTVASWLRSEAARAEAGE